MVTIRQVSWWQCSWLIVPGTTFAYDRNLLIPCLSRPLDLIWRAVHVLADPPHRPAFAVSQDDGLRLGLREPGQQSRDLDLRLGCAVSRRRSAWTGRPPGDRPGGPRIDRSSDPARHPGPVWPAGVCRSIGWPGSFSASRPSQLRSAPELATVPVVRQNSVSWTRSDGSIRTRRSLGIRIVAPGLSGNPGIARGPNTLKAVACSPPSSANCIMVSPSSSVP